MLFLLNSKSFDSSKQVTNQIGKNKTYDCKQGFISYKLPFVIYKISYNGNRALICNTYHTVRIYVITTILRKDATYLLLCGRNTTYLPRKSMRDSYRALY